MCCGQGRAAAAAAAAPPADLYVAPTPSPPSLPPPAAAREAAPAAPTTVRVRYTHGRSVRVSGPASGRVYEFSVAAAVQSVDARDADGLVGTGFFRRVY
jgi:hypothetical protein